MSEHIGKVMFRYSLLEHDGELGEKSPTITLKGLQSSVTENRVKVSAKYGALHAVTPACTGGGYKRSHYSKRSTWKHVHPSAEKHNSDPVGMWEMILRPWWEQDETFQAIFSKVILVKHPCPQSSMAAIRSRCFSLAGGIGLLLKSKEEWMVQMNSFSLLKN